MSFPPSSNILICGMHRSGTSLTGKFFENIGYHFGDHDELVAARSSNKEGFWERKDVVRLNDKMLALFGSSWDYPLQPNANQIKEITQKNILGLADEARTIIQKLKPPFAIKDPRISLLLPFWQELVPDAKIIIVVRNPIEVAKSINKRNHNSIQLGLMLWKRYYQAILSHTDQTNRFFLFNEALLNINDNFLRAILEYLGLNDIDHLHAAVVKSVNKSLMSFSDEPAPELLLKAPYHKEINQLWQMMRHEAGYLNNKE